MKKRGSNFERWAALALTVIIISVLIFSGPASAITVGLEKISGSASPIEGGALEFSGKIDLHTPDVISLKKIVIILDSTPDDGLDNGLKCYFHLNGSAYTNNSALCHLTLDTFSSNLTDLGTAVGEAYGYAYHFTNESYGKTNYTFNTGYQYGYTSGLGFGTYSDQLGSNAELELNFTWTTPTVSGDTDYKIGLGVIAGESANRVMFLSQNPIAITVVNKNTNDNSGSSGDSTTSQTTTSQTTTSQTTTSQTTTSISEEKNVEEQIKETLDAEDFGLTDEEFDAEDLVIEEVIPEEPQQEVVVEVTEEKIAAAKEAAVDEKAKEVIGKIEKTLKESKEQQVQVSSELKVYKVKSKSTGKEIYVSKVVLSFKADKDMKDVRIVEVIPKSVAADVSELVFNYKPLILQADPIVQWVFDKLNKGDSKDLSYTVKKRLDKVESTTLSTFEPEEVCVQVVTHAINDQTKECKAFASPCEVPKGWSEVNKCPVIPVVPQQGLNLREQMTIYLGIIMVLVLIVWLFVYRRPTATYYEPRHHARKAKRHSKSLSISAKKK